MEDEKIYYEEFFRPDGDAAGIIRRRALARAETVRQLLPEYRARAVSAAGVEDMRVLERIREACASVPEGTDWRTARKAVEAELEGVSKNARARAEFLLRTHVQQARAMAKWRDIQRDAAFLPYLMYQTLGDDKVRPSHRALDGKILPAGDDFWKTHFPPWDYGCRCVVVQLTEKTARELAEAKDSNAEFMAPSAKQDFEARFREEGRGDYRFRPDETLDISELDYPPARKKEMLDILKNPAHTVVNEKGERENAFEYLWRRGPQEKDEEWLKAEREKAKEAHPQAEFAVVRDSETGQVLARYKGLDGEVEDTKGLLDRKGGEGGWKLWTTHIHPTFAAPSPRDVLTALNKRASARETVITEWSRQRLSVTDEARNHGRRLREEAEAWALRLKEAENAPAKEFKKIYEEWERWLRAHRAELKYEENAK